ncbi:hypothetical protein B14911_16135 [Bacillus sp. NRRL B-14911]|nr:MULTISPECIES: hypothetical protein [Bacillus]EAR67058.1 hypothetical protein B14911_16135 [Bacillus sp. NRRL B-14911]
MMISLARILKLRDLEIFQVIRNVRVLAYSIIEDTRNPFTEEDKKMDPLCFMDEEDISEILNVFRVALISDKKLSKADSITLSILFGVCEQHPFDEFHHSGICSKGLV